VGGTEWIEDEHGGAVFIEAEYTEYDEDPGDD
jgi:hypothetical protein